MLIILCHRFMEGFFWEIRPLVRSSQEAGLVYFTADVEALSQYKRTNEQAWKRDAPLYSQVAL